MGARTPEQTFLVMLAHLARITKTELTKEDVALYDQALEPYGYEQVCDALKKIIEGRDARDPFPSIKEIRDTLVPSSDPESEAQLIAGRILQAISSIGPHQAERFRTFVGPVAWQVILQSGGLETVCNVQDKDIPFNRAQWIKLAVTLQRRGLEQEERAALPDPEGQARVAEIVRKITHREGT